MNVYLVGGACRDILMRKIPKDMDYVVVGETPDTMKERGFKQVGTDFPVFLHPETGNEYALARTEKKQYTGYCGFSSVWENVSLEQDLSRRDLTINAIAWDSSFEIIDPYNGRDDINNKVLRHVSEAFVEDPVRVLRVARFLARLGPEWTVHPDTFTLCRELAIKEFKYLTPERVFKEMEKALTEQYPWLFFEFLSSLDSYWFRELWDLQTIPQPIKHHPENWTFDHIMLALKQGVKVRAKPHELFAILCHDFGKAPCWVERGNLHGHEEAGVPYVHSLCDRLKVPKKYRDLAIKVCEHHQRSHRAFEMRPKSIHKLFKKLDCIRNPEILTSFNLCNWCDATGRLGLQDKVYDQPRYLRTCLNAVLQVDSKGIMEKFQTMDLPQKSIGAKIGEYLRCSQIVAIKGVKVKWQKN